MLWIALKVFSMHLGGIRRWVPLFRYHIEWTAPVSEVLQCLRDTSALLLRKYAGSH